MKQKILIIDDDEDIQMQMRWALESEYEIVQAENREGAVHSFQEHRPRVTLLDLGLPPTPTVPTEGLAALEDILGIDRLAKVIIVSGQSEHENAMRAVAQGAHDFVNKPVDLEELRIILKRCCRIAQLEQDYREHHHRAENGEFEEMLGNGPSMQETFRMIRKVAPSDAPVLILGESGTGKEMAGRAIHRLSPRKDGPFVAINCGAIPENLLESELFGHEKGAFTGAHASRPGRLEAAHQGTLFLDELGELPPPLQVKLLRFLQDRTIERVGGRRAIDVDTRIIAATNADLKASMTAGTFREDLYYRLAVVVIKIPALREREDDVLMLAHAFLKRFAAQVDCDSLAFSEQAMRAIQKHRWPGNVRELENRIKRGIIMAEGNIIHASDLELTSADEIQIGQTHSLKEAREALEREMISRALRKNRGKIAPTAADLGISRPTLYELISKLGLKRD